MNAIARQASGAWSLPQFAPGTLTALKWLGLALMTVDHVDAFVFDRTLTWAGQLGRLVFPIFALVIAYNLARPGTLERGVYSRICGRLVLVGICAQPVHGILTGAAWGLVPLNILATFAAFSACAWLLELGQVAIAGLVFLVAGALVEYAWPGVGLCLAIWQLYRRPSSLALCVVLVAWASLALVNATHAALWAIPLLVLGSRLQLDLGRSQWLFYAYYPAHLVAFLLLELAW